MNPALYKSLIRPLLFQMDPEEAHHLAHRTARQFRGLMPLLSSNFVYKGSDLACNLFGRKLNNPVGLAAGFDKNGDLVGVLGYVGFGFAEVGSVTAIAKQGNPKPRLFRLEKDQALINRLGLNGEGAEVVANKLKRSKLSLPIGLNIAKTNDPNITGDTAIEDMVYSFNQIKNLQLAYVAINASCPNTKEGIVTEASQMKTVFTEVQKANSRNLPILVKLSPDSGQELIEQMVDAATGSKLAGFICGNTSTSRDGLDTDSARVQEIGMGGLSGGPIKNKAIRLCQLVYSLKQPAQIIIGCGGVASGKDAYDFMAAGASFVQLYTGLVYEGPALPLMINQQLSTILKQKKMSLKDVVGSGTVICQK